MYSTAPALIRLVRMLSADDEGSMLKVPGAMRPSIRRWSLASSVTGSTAHGGTANTVGGPSDAAARRSSTETQRLLPSRSTQVAREINEKMPGLNALVFMSVGSSS